MASSSAWADTSAYPKFPTIIHALAKAAELAPDATGLVCEERELTYGQYARAVAALAKQLADIGVRDARIAVVASNGLDTGVALLAGMAARAQVSPLNPNYTEAELEPLLRDVDPKIIVCDAGSVAKATALARKVGISHVIQIGPGGVTAEELLARPAVPLMFPEERDLSVMFFTGGTTGMPKGANHTNLSLMAFCYAVVALWPFPLGKERILNVAPLFHVWGFCFTVVAPIYVRAMMDIMPAYKPALVLEEF